MNINLPSGSVLGARQQKGEPGGGEYSRLDTLIQGQVHLLESPANLLIEVQNAFDEIQRLAALGPQSSLSQWGRFSVIARRWEHLEPMAAICKLNGIPFRLLRDNHMLDLHTTREGFGLLSLLKGHRRSLKKQRVIIRAGILARWFRLKYGCRTDSLIGHPYRAMLAQFICELDAEAPGADRTVTELIESLYEYGSGSRGPINSAQNSPVSLLTAHRAKGLEFDHVVVLDGRGWSDGGDEERRLFYVAMTRAKKTLTLSRQAGSGHRFVEDCVPMCIRTVPASGEPDNRLTHRLWTGDPEHVVLSWPGFFAPNAAIHRTISSLEVRDALTISARGDGKPGWELRDTKGRAVARMAKKFVLPNGGIVAIRVAAILARSIRPTEVEVVRCKNWEVVIPEIEYTALEHQ